MYKLSVSQMLQQRNVLMKCSNCSDASHPLLDYFHFVLEFQHESQPHYLFFQIYFFILKIFLIFFLKMFFIFVIYYCIFTFLFQRISIFKCFFLFYFQTIFIHALIKYINTINYIMNSSLKSIMHFPSCSLLSKNN